MAQAKRCRLWLTLGFVAKPFGGMPFPTSLGTLPFRMPRLPGVGRLWQRRERCSLPLVLAAPHADLVGPPDAFAEELNAVSATEEFYGSLSPASSPGPPTPEDALHIDACSNQEIDSEPSPPESWDVNTNFEEAADDLARLQAILASLPQHAVPLGGGSSGNARGAPSVGRLLTALHRACLEYPQRADELRELEVVHASLDLVCLADHSGRRLFTAARGTDRALRGATLPRDLGNDALIALGFGPARVSNAIRQYQEVCERLPGFASFGCGHSLGASVIEGLARWAEAGPGRTVFQRIDLFNPASSPLRKLVRGTVPLVQTEVHAHRVPGDFVSRFHHFLGCSKHVHPRRPRLSAHALGHFLPTADEAAIAARAAVAQCAAAVVARVTGAQVAARTAVAAIGSRAVARAVLAERSVLIAEAAAAADAQGRRPPHTGPLARLRLRRSEATALRQHARAGWRKAGAARSSESRRARHAGGDVQAAVASPANTA
uniref:Uncharacterized protein n=1 Tax=Alexandrium monilatum TaxID=311494 RepID=A0A7S4SIT7_9DINO